MSVTAKIKLTPAQLSLLQEKRGGFVDSYKPGLRLIELGLIDVTGKGYFRWTINASGEEALALIAKYSVKEEKTALPAHETLDLAWPVLKQGKVRC